MIFLVEIFYQITGFVVAAVVAVDYFVGAAGDFVNASAEFFIKLR